jgi:hypothetical protein
MQKGDALQREAAVAQENGNRREEANRARGADASIRRRLRASESVDAVFEKRNIPTLFE